MNKLCNNSMIKALSVTIVAAIMVLPVLVHAADPSCDKKASNTDNLPWLCTVACIWTTAYKDSSRSIPATIFCIPAPAGYKCRNKVPDETVNPVYKTIWSAPCVFGECDLASSTFADVVDNGNYLIKVTDTNGCGGG